MDEEDKPVSGISGNYDRTRFAELLRRVEHGKERVRLTRRGKPIAYVVPLEDIERLQQLDVATPPVIELPQPPVAEPAPAEPPFAEPLSAEPLAMPDLSMPGMPDDSPPSLLSGLETDVPFDMDIPEMPLEIEPHHELMLEHNDDDQRGEAIAGFKKGLNRIFTATELLSRSEMAQRLRKDSYLSSALRRILGEA